MYDIEFTQGAIDDLRFLKKNEQQQVIAGIESQLLYEPNVETRNRKRLRPNDVSEWELRLGKYRVFYDVEATVRIIKVEAIGYKEGNQLFIRGEPYQL
ncbi:type II toxin-antitoxin system RelE/ParE family toxin [Nodosilinea sp. P-1105]|uniref:type II toxin-antitoxin system RelE family toxin n=1 Tax=Nodosilinea sp. P-1105 TaxID=2546229 RepID=UPI00146E1672|nr:type II toxin-antitoxin system RelE/ParE family toxin [Nodosilinea sp. P-1105]NMF86030.1 addiction module toxin RelE [Nodosilinea sp. P-1105]